MHFDNMTGNSLNKKKASFHLLSFKIVKHKELKRGTGSYFVLVVHSDIFDDEDEIKSGKDGRLQVNIILCCLKEIEFS